MLPQIPSDREPGVTVNARGAARPPVQAALVGGSPERRVTALDSLHRALPAQVRVVPMPALLAWSGVGAIAAAVLCSVAMRSPKAIEALEDVGALEPSASTPAPRSAAPSAAMVAPKPAAATASKAEIDAARVAGADGVAALALRFPEDPAVSQALFLAQAGDHKSYGAAMRTVRRLLDQAPAAAADEDVRRALVAIANGPTETAVAALDLMATDLGLRGAEMLFEVASGNVLLSKTKAAALLNDPTVRRHATPALLVANDLRASLPCARKVLLSRARADADARALPYLKPLTNTACGGGGGGGLRGFLGRAAGNSGGGECYRCISPAERADIQGIVTAIEARTPTPAAPATAP
jgi:hypothetical protein